MSGVLGDLAHWQQQLAAALGQHHERYRRFHRAWGDGTQLVGCVCGWSGTDMRSHRAAALVPVLRAYGDARAAHALTDAADNCRRPHGNGCLTGVQLRDRAAALLARTDTEGADDGRC